MDWAGTDTRRAFRLQANPDGDAQRAEERLASQPLASVASAAARWGSAETRSW
jgi:hypothetical protein